MAGSRNDAAKPKKPRGPGRRFQPGESGNPAGKAKQDPAIRTFRETTYKDFVAGLQKYGDMDKAELKAEGMRGDIRAFDAIFAKVVEQAVDGEKDARAVLLDRLWGKPKEMEFGAIAHQELLSRIPISDLVELARKAKEAPKE